MHFSLKLHPDSRCMAATGIEVAVVRPRAGELALRYVVTGGMSGLLMPPETEPGRADELWRRTCFEAFVRASPGPAYYEFNFAPSTQWAAYWFSDYRNGMSAADGIGAPRIEAQSDDNRYELRASLSGLPGDAAWHVGLSAVIEEADGNISYWALAHPPGKPDFHHSDCFALEVPAAWRP